MTVIIWNEGAYFVEYENELSADYALKKLNNFKITPDEVVAVNKRIDVKKELIKNLEEKHLNQPNVSFADYFMNILKKPQISIPKAITASQVCFFNNLN